MNSPLFHDFLSENYDELQLLPSVEFLVAYHNLW